MIVNTCRKLAGNTNFQGFIIVVIALNAVFMGLETNREITQSYGQLLYILDRTIQGIFVIEIFIRVTSFWPSISKFFKDGWNVFDFTVIALSLIPTIGPFATVARVARILRVARLISLSEDLKLIIGTMLKSIPSLGHVSMLLVLLMYVYGVIGWHFFHQIDPDRWGTLGAAVMSLFEILTLEGWIEMQNAVIGVLPYAWMFFVSFIVIAVFVVVNLFIAVVLNNLQKIQNQILKKK